MVEQVARGGDGGVLLPLISRNGRSSFGSGFPASRGQPWWEMPTLQVNIAPLARMVMSLIRSSVPATTDRTVAAASSPSFTTRTRKPAAALSGASMCWGSADWGSVD